MIIILINNLQSNNFIYNMDRSLKKLLRLYPIARNWAVLSNYITPFQSVQSLSRIYNTNLKGN